MAVTNLQEVKLYNGDRVIITVTELGAITLTRTGRFDTTELCQRDAVDVAAALLDAVRYSQDRNQRAVPSYYSTEAVERRRLSPLGQAQAAVAKVFR